MLGNCVIERHNRTHLCSCTVTVALFGFVHNTCAVGAGWKKRFNDVVHGFCPLPVGAGDAVDGDGASLKPCHHIVVVGGDAQNLAVNMFRCNMHDVSGDSLFSAKSSTFHVTCMLISL